MAKGNSSRRSGGTRRPINSTEFRRRRVQQSGRAAEQKNWTLAIPAAVRGITKIFGRYRSRLLGQSDILIVLMATITLTTIIFAISLFIRYGRPMAHDFRETIGQRVRGGTVTVLAVALLFLPLFLWRGQMCWCLLAHHLRYLKPRFRNGPHHRLRIFVAEERLLELSRTDAGVASDRMAAIATTAEILSRGARRMQDS